MTYRIVNGMLICDVPDTAGVSDEVINQIAKNTANTMDKNRSPQKILEDTIRGKKAEYAIEKYIEKNFSNEIEYVSYDKIRNDNYTCHAPFDGLFISKKTPATVKNNLIDRILKEVMDDKPYGRLSIGLRNDMVDAGIFTFEIKSSELKNGDPKLSDYEGITDLYTRKQEDYEKIANNILAKWDFFIFPHYCRKSNDIFSFFDYVEFIRNNSEKFGLTSAKDYYSFLEPLIHGEFDNASEIQTRIFFDNYTNELYIPGYTHKMAFFIGVPTLTRMMGKVSGSTLYFTRSINMCRWSFENMPRNNALWSYDRNKVYSQLYYNHTNELICPHCGDYVKPGMYGYYCSQGKNCNMKISYYFGSSLDNEVVEKLLKGKTAEFTKNNETIILTPSIKYNVFKGDLQYIWVEKKKEF